MIRALFHTTKIPTAAPPYDTATLKIYYPALPTGSEMERMTGVIPADATLAPFPVVIFLPGINVEPQAYQWLAVRLAEAGLVVVCYSWIAEEMPGYISLTPGVDLAAVKPDRYGQQPTCPALAPILNELAALNGDPAHTQYAIRNTPLKGLLDLTTIILGGHSAGGTMALQNVHPDWFPHIQGAFTYGAHTMASTMLEYAAGTILPVEGKRPFLLLGGTHDGVIAASTRRYGIEGTATLALERTFAEAIAGGRGDSYLVIIDGANHFSLVHPVDETTGRPFLDHPTTQPDHLIRDELAALITLFINGHIRHRPADRATLQQRLLSNPLIASSQNK